MLRTSTRGLSPAPISSSTSSTALLIAAWSCSGAEASTTCRSRSARRVSSERRAEGVHHLMGKLADEPDGVGQEVRAPADAQHARARVKRVEEAVAHPHLRVGEDVEQGALARVGVAGERDARQGRSLALGAHHRTGALARAPGGGAVPRCGCARGAGRSRSASPPARACRSRRRGARGASTGRACAPGCIRAGRAPPAACPRRCEAWVAKMSRITVVRSTTGIPSACSRLRSWRALSSSSQAITFASHSCAALLCLVDLARAQDRCWGGARHAAGSSPQRPPPRRCAAARAAPRGSPRQVVTATQKARWRRAGWVGSSSSPV